MNEDYQKNLDNLNQLIEDVKDKTDINEAQTRFEIINTLFTNCLGWSKHKDIEVEKQTHEGYADYILNTSRSVMVIEAKRTSKYFTLPTSDKPTTHSLPDLIKRKSVLSEAIKQARSYAQSMGIPIAVVSNGLQYVAFVASRSDGQPPLEGKAIAYTSLQQISEHFSDFWNLFSKDGVIRGDLQKILIHGQVPDVPRKPSLYISDYPGNYARNSIQSDMLVLAELILGDIYHAELEKEFLKYCYCESGALSQYSSLARNELKNRYEQIDDSSNIKIERVNTKKGINKDFLHETYSKSPIILIGDVGVGKTQFIRNLIKSENSILDKHDIALHVNLGETAILSNKVKDGALTTIREILLTEYEIDINEDAFVREVYRDNLDRLKNSIFKALDPKDFTLKEIEELSQLISNEAEHIKRSIDYITTQRHHPKIVIFLDNTDQRNSLDQQEIFLIAHELSSQTKATVFVSIRPETFYLSYKDGVLKAYHPKAYTIEPPRIDLVLKKRLEFGLMIAKGEIDAPSLGEQGMKLANLTTMLEVMLRTLNSNYVEQKKLVATIDNIASGNVRRAIDMIKDFLSNGHTNTQRILEIEEENPGSYYIPMHEFLKTMINGDNRYYNPNTSVISNVFDIRSKDPKEYFLALLLLDYLIKMSTSEISNHGFLGNADVYNRLQSLGYLPEQIEICINKLLQDEMVENPINNLLKDSEIATHSIRTTPKGAIYVNLLAGTFQYIDAMLVDIPIIDSDLFSQINESFENPEASIEVRLSRSELFISYLNDIYKSELLDLKDRQLDNLIVKLIGEFRMSTQKVRVSLARTLSKRSKI